MASGGSGKEISTLLAEERSLNWLRALTRYSVRERLWRSTVHSTQISGRTFWLSRYVLYSQEGRAQHPQRDFYHAYIIACFQLYAVCLHRRNGAALFMQGLSA